MEVSGLVLRRRSLRGLVLAVALAAVLPIPAAAATSPTFGDISAIATFGTGVDISEPAVLPDGVVRVEAVVDAEGSTRSFVAAVPGLGAGSTTIRYRYATPLGGQLPNTHLTVHFRVTLVDRTLVDGPTTSVLYSDTRATWQSLAGKVVRVHWTVGGAAFGQRALKIADDAVGRISALLGVTEADPIDFFIYADRNAFYDVLGPSSRENVGGVAFPEIRTLFANIDAGTIDDPWVGVVIPHELTHLIIDTATKNPYHGVPHWMNEGIAVYESESYSPSDRSQVRGAVSDGSIMPLSGLDGQFPTTAQRFSLAYAESVSAIDFLVRRYGQDALVKLIRSYAGGVTDDEAFTAALGVDVKGFEAAWLKDLGAPTPKAYGPRAAPAGPVPSGWDGAAPTPGVVEGPIPTAAGAAPIPPSLNGGSTSSLLIGSGLGVIAIVLLVVLLRQMGRAAAGRATTETPAGWWTASETHDLAGDVEPPTGAPPTDGERASDDHASDDRASDDRTSDDRTSDDETLDQDAAASEDPRS